MMAKIHFRAGGVIEKCKVVRETDSYVHVIEEMGAAVPRHLLIPWTTIHFLVILTQASKLGTE